MTKRSKTLNFYLTILESIKRDGKLPDLPMMKQNLNYYVCRLKKEGKIRRIGYGVWEYLEPEKEVKVCTIGYSSPPALIFFKSDDVRLHNLMFKVKNRGYNWAGVLRLSGVYYDEFKPNVFRVIFNGFKVWLARDRVIVWVKPELDFRASRVDDSLKLALEWFYRFYASFEAYLGLSVTPSDSLVWSFGRKHISLVNNVIAKDFNAKGIKLRVYDSRGLWLIADNSFNLGELEGVRNDDNVVYMNRLKEVFNDYKNNLNTPLPSEAYLLHLELFKSVALTKATIDSIVRRLGWDDA